MENHDKTMVSYAVGAGANLGKGDNKVSSWADLVKLLSTPTKTNEKHKVYMKMSRDEQLRLKSINGWISGAQCEGGIRKLANVKPRDLMTLDLDYPWDTFWDDMVSGVHWLAGFESVTLSTRSSTPQNPRRRVILPMSRKVQPDEYGPLVRIVSLRIDYENTPMEQVDTVSSRRAQMMFLPTISKDQVYEFLRTRGNLLDPDEQFAWFEEHYGDWRDISILPLYKGEEGLRKHADKAEDPWLKPGVIGDFCRAWPIEDLIAEHLSDIYVPGDSSSAKPRYTYTGGSASNGAVVEDDGRFLYSHHGTDPVGEQLVNAWDLYRIHMFGKLDEKVNPDTPIMEWPSSKAMREFIQTEPRYCAERTKSRYDLGAMLDDSDVGEEDDEVEVEEDLSAESAEYTEEAEDDFGLSDDDLAAADDEEPPEKPKSKKTKTAKNPKAKTWFGEELEVNKNGDIVSSVHNVAAILYNDPRFYGKLRWDDFTLCVRLFGDIASRSENVPTLHCLDKDWGDRWSQIGHQTVRAILATPNGPGKVGYGLATVAERDIADGVVLAAMRNRYHPIKDFLEKEEWDGVSRVERLFVDYLGMPDTAYARETAKLALIASVARTYEPGMKFDYAPILQGDQGIRKSTFIRTLYTPRWFGEVTNDLGDAKAVSEQIAGKWGNELPELAFQNKTGVAETKAFLSRQENTVRFSYDRQVTVIRRQSLFWGTTNEDVYLRDRTGNRRFWPLRVTVGSIDTTALQEALPQLWAEALELYRALRVMYPRNQHEDLPLMLSGTADAEAKLLQEGVREQQMDEEWSRFLVDAFDHPITIHDFASAYGKDPASFLDKGVIPDGVYVQRTVFRAADAAAALGIEWPVPRKAGEDKLLLKAIKAMPGWIADPRGDDGRYKRWGSEKTSWYIREDADPIDVKRGFVFADAPEHAEAEFVGSEFTDEDLDAEEELNPEDLV
ncbi:virulence-associated E family protein [Devosia sp. 1635]|uniref:virulence-associated E family protein n=1 Tax=Devosia sp. 1635 TaxID=2726066 RepID=UPI00156740E5|nr:virulence-associated E family protein [Devosia sp. 1635]